MKSAFSLESRPGSRPARRIAATAVAIAVGATLLLAGCSSSAVTFPSTATLAPTEAPVTGTSAAATAAPATLAAPTAVAASIVFVPASFSCADSTTPVAITWILAAGTSADTQILYEWDGSLGQGGQTPQALADAGFTQQSNGTWQQAQNSTGADLCTNLGLAAGSHTWSVMKAQSDGTPGAVLAQGSFTVTP